MKLLDTHLVDDWRNGWRKWSVRLAAATGSLAALILTNQSLVLSLLSYLPTAGFARLLAAVSIGLIVFIVPTLTVLLKQKSDAQGR